MSERLRNEMKDMIKSIQDLIAESGETDHQFMCSCIADDYELWKDNKFPIWLSRVVEGVIRDMGEGITDE